MNPQAPTSSTSSLVERHRSGRAAWLRAAVLGADDAIVSTASLMIGVSASAASKEAILVAGVAGLVAGAMSMAVGEYVSVSSQRDAEHGDIAREQKELEAIPAAELDELIGIYVGRGLDPALARQVAEQLTAHDALKAHLRDELNIDADALAKPLQAAWISALSFAAFAMVPVGALLAAPLAWALPTIAATSIVSLMILGAIGGVLGGANPLRAAIRVAVGGSLAMGITAGIGRLMGVAVS